ncbi:unnamed protein product, partial [Rotaria magnacalcarata]
RLDVKPATEHNSSYDAKFRSISSFLLCDEVSTDELVIKSMEISPSRCEVIPSTCTSSSMSLKPLCFSR